MVQGPEQVARFDLITNEAIDPVKIGLCADATSNRFIFW